MAQGNLWLTWSVSQVFRNIDTNVSGKAGNAQGYNIDINVSREKTKLVDKNYYWVLKKQHSNIVCE